MPAKPYESTYPVHPLKSLVYEFPLRPDYTAQFVLPRDFTKQDARRICAFINALPPKEKQDAPTNV